MTLSRPGHWLLLALDYIVNSDLAGSLTVLTRDAVPVCSTANESDSIRLVQRLARGRMYLLRKEFAQSVVDGFLFTLVTSQG